jgi:heme a synthase
MSQTRTSTNSRPQPLARWLLIVAGLVIVTIVVGGITRLTESGLSITQWKPLSGILPPLSEAAWANEFAHYRAIDQYAAIHSGMSMAQFKGIFIWEYLHRILGRVVGMAIALPLVWFWLRRAIPTGYHLRLLALLALVGLQGALGWLMVRSGLQHGMIAVAPQWLAAHLLTALFTLSGLIWTALDLIYLAKHPNARPARLTPFTALIGAILALQLAYGALMAGLRAGHVSDSWPLMNGRFYPGPTQLGRGMPDNLTADPAIVHFIHRWLAWILVFGLIILARRVKNIHQRPISIAIHCLFGVQILLGIATIISGVAIWLAVLHQLIGALLVATCAWACHSLGRRN